MAKVEALRHHTFAGKDYAPGDTYAVKGDAHQTEDQYLDTLRGSGLARPVGEEGPNVVQEVGEVSVQPASHPVEPLRTEHVAPEPAKPAKATKAKGAKSGKK